MLNFLIERGEEILQDALLLNLFLLLHVLLLLLKVFVLRKLLIILRNSQSVLHLVIF